MPPIPAGSDTAGTIAGHLGFGTVRVDQTRYDVVVTGACGNPLNTIGYYPLLAVAYIAGEGMNIRRCQRCIDDQEIVPASDRLGELHRCHSPLALRTISTRWIACSFRRRSTSSCCRCDEASTVKNNRCIPSVP